MGRTGSDSDLRVGGLPLRLKFTLSMSLALAAVMGVAGLLLVNSSRSLAESSLESRVISAVELTARECRPENFEQVGDQARPFGNVKKYDVVYGLERGERHPAEYYEYKERNQTRGLARLMFPPDTGETGRGMMGLIIGVTLAVIIAGALVALVVSSQVSKPINAIVDDIRQIARGDLRHRSRVRAGGEVALVARAVNRMAESLEDAQEAQIELSVREREMAVADEVREALHPDEVPVIAGYDLGAMHIGSPQPGGDFHDFVELADGRVGLLVCGVSGKGVPGALVGATARSYLRSELARSQDPAEALRVVNRYLARDVRRGMYVTAMYVLLDPRGNKAEVVCAGHKVPLLRFGAADRKLRLVQPEGIALGFDKGPVFDRALSAQTVALEPGDRLLVSNTGPLQLQDPRAEELGEKAFYKLVLGWAARDTSTLLKKLEAAFEQYAEDAPYPNDISIVSVARRSAAAASSSSPSTS